MRAPSESLRQHRGERGVLCCNLLELAGLAVRPDETQDDRRYRLVENQHHNGRRLCHHRAIGRVAANERSMRVRRARLCKRGQQDANNADGTHRLKSSVAVPPRRLCSRPWGRSREQSQARRRLRVVGRCLSSRWNFDPAVYALLALLHDWEIERLAGFEITCEEG